MFVQKRKTAVNVIQRITRVFKETFPAIIGRFLWCRKKEAGIDKHLHNSIGIILFFRVTLPIGQEGMDAKSMIDLAQCGIAEVFSQTIADTKSVWIVESKVNWCLFSLLFLIEFHYTFSEMSNGVGVLFFQFIQPADRFNCFLPGTFFRFVVIIINNGKTNSSVCIWCFF